MQLLLDTLRRRARRSRSATTSSATRSSTGPSGPACAPQQYYDQLVRSGAAGVVFGDVRRGKALAQIVEQVKIKDTNGERLSLADLRGADDRRARGPRPRSTTRVTTTTEARRTRGSCTNGLSRQRNGAYSAG